MTSKAVQIVCLTLGVIGLVGVITCCAIPLWKTTVFIGWYKKMTPQVVYEGLWMNCVTQSTGHMRCRVYDSMLHLPSDLQAGRFMTVISCILCGLSLLILFFGSDLTRCFQNQGTKSKLRLVAAAGLLLAGLLVIIPVSWSADTIIRAIYHPFLMSALKRELGAGIYIGWVAGVLMILTGVLLCCFSRPRTSRGAFKYHRATDLHDVAI